VARFVFVFLALACSAPPALSDACGGATLCASFEPATTSFATPKPIQLTTEGGLRWWVGIKGHNALDTTRIALVGFGRDGASALKITTQNDDRCVESGTCNQHTFERAEISLDSGAPGATTGAVEDSEQWWAHSVYFPPEFQIRSGFSAQALVLQFHNGGRQPAIVLEVYNQRGANAWKVFRARAQGPNGSDKVGTQYFYKPPGAGPQSGQCIHDNVAEGVWYDFVHHIKWSSSGRGFHRIWMREGAGPVKQVLDQSRLSAIYAPGDPNGRPYAYLKLGLYHSPVVAGEGAGERLAKDRSGAYLPPLIPGVSSVIHDRIRRGASFAAVAPADFKMPSGGVVLCSGSSLVQRANF
jgi:hypothetical protein